MKIALLVTALVAVTLSAVAPPVWPSQYYASGIFSIPYFEIVEPIEIYYDGVNNRELLSYYNGMDTYLWRFDIQTLFQVIPRIDQMMCFNSTGIGNGPLTTLLPDLSDWIFRGIEKKHGVQCNVWEQIVTNFNKTATYKMYVSSTDNAPVELHLNGYDFVFGSHPDVYIMSFKQYKPNFYDADVFEAPALCNNSTVSASHNSVLRSRALLGRIAGMAPPKQLDNEFDLFVHTHKKVYADVNEYVFRKSVYQNNVDYINKFNAQNKGHQLAVNHLADYTQEEVQAMLYPKTTVKRSEVPSNADYTHVVSGKTTPAQINWVDLGAVTPVKDQGVCGSCWTFGTTGSIEGAWFMKTGNLVSLSEQQIVDCAWGPWIQGNSGCDGGFAGPAYEWIMQNGGIALENTYKYLMMDHWCNAYDISSGVTLTGYVNVTSGSEADLLDAVATVGPVTVAIDASHPSLTFYTSGVYYEPACGNTPDDLDHQVLVVGYGTENGQDYWLVKNSWSTHWGDQGFVKMSRNRGNNCGIATQAQYPLV